MYTYVKNMYVSIFFSTDVSATAHFLIKGGGAVGSLWWGCC